MLSEPYRASVESGVGVFAVQCELSADTAPLILQANSEWTKALALPAQIADYRKSPVIIQPESIRQAALRVVRAGQRGLMVPTALLVAREQLPLWHDYSWLMAQVGLRRQAFSDFEAALDWAADQAALWAAQADHRKRGR